MLGLPYAKWHAGVFNIHNIFSGGNCGQNLKKVSKNCSSGRYTCSSGRLGWKLLKIYVWRYIKSVKKFRRSPLIKKFLI